VGGDENGDMDRTGDLRLQLGRHVTGHDAGDLLGRVDASLAQHDEARELLAAADRCHRHGFAFEVVESL